MTTGTYLEGVSRRIEVLDALGRFSKFDVPIGPRRIVYLIGAAKFSTSTPYHLVAMDTAAFADAIAAATAGKPWADVVRAYGRPVFRGVPGDPAAVVTGQAGADLSPSYPAAMAAADLAMRAERAEALLRSAPEPEPIHVMRNMAALAGLSWTLPQARKIYALEHGLGEARATALSNGGTGAMTPTKLLITPITHPTVLKIRAALPPPATVYTREGAVNLDKGTDWGAGTARTVVGAGVGGIIGAIAGGLAKGLVGAGIGAAVGAAAGGGVAYATQS